MTNLEIWGCCFAFLGLDVQYYMGRYNISSYLNADQ